MVRKIHTRKIAIVSLYVIISFIGLMIPSVVCSTTLLKLSLEDLAQHATSIVECEVVGSEIAWDAQQTRIYTYVNLNVTHVYAGALLPGPLTIRMLGGAVGDIAMVIPGAPWFAAGERLLLFLEEGPDLLFPIVGLTQGKLAIAVDPQTEVEWAGNPEIGFFPKQELLDRVAQAREGR